MAAVASFQGVKVVSKARAAKVNVRAAPVANLQKASKVGSAPRRWHPGRAGGRLAGAQAGGGPPLAAPGPPTRHAVVAGVLEQSAVRSQPAADRRPRTA